MSSLPVTALCVPDLYLTEERVNMLFDDFRNSVPESQQSGVIFASLVNSVRQLYLSQILHLQQVLISTPTSELAVRCDEQLAALHDRLAAQHKMQVDDLADIHSRQLGVIREREGVLKSKDIPTEWIVGIDVVYGDQESQKPPNCIKEMTGYGDSINFLLGGKYYNLMSLSNGHFLIASRYVWLLSKMSKDCTTALTGVRIAIQSPKDEQQKDLAKGAGGKYRYLIPLSGDGPDKIYSMNLLRLNHTLVGAPCGYDGASSDINHARETEAGCLYLVWKSHPVKP